MTEACVANILLHLTVWCGIYRFYFEKNRVFHAGGCLEYVSME